MTNDNLTSYQNYLFKIAILLIVVISLLIVLNKLGQYYDILVLPITFNATFLVYGIIAQIILLLIISYVWKYNIYICANKIISLKASFTQISLLLVGKYIPGKIWGMYARSLNLISHKISYRESLLGTYIEQLISVHSGLAFGVTAWLVANKPWLLIPSVAFILFTIFYSPLIQNKVFRIASRFRKKGSDEELEIEEFELDRRSYSKLFLLYLLEWIFTGLALVILYFALFDKPASANFIFLLMGSAAIAFVAGFFTVFAPGGIGVREGVIVGLIAQHILLSDSIILVLVFRIWFTCSDVLAGLFGLLLWGNSVNQNMIDSELQ